MRVHICENWLLIYISISIRILNYEMYNFNVTFSTLSNIENKTLYSINSIAIYLEFKITKLSFNY